MYEDKPKDHSVDDVKYLNVYDPVKYMLKNMKRRSSLMMDNKIDEANQKEGGRLIRDGHVLRKVEGDAYYRYLLYYNEKGLLSEFVVEHKLTGREEKWTLHFAPNGYLIKYDYLVVNEGYGVDDGEFDEEGNFQGNNPGEIIDPYL